MPQIRQLAAIMFTDIVGYTALMGADEKMAFELLKRNREVQKPLVKHFNGTWIKELGDGVLASFHTVTDAVVCSAAIHNACNAVDGLKLRIGIHLGEVVFENNDVFGDGVNIASRLQALAPIGRTYISESVYKNVSNKKEIITEYVREELLKNVSEPVKIYEIKLNGDFLPGQLTDLKKRSKGASAKKKKIIVAITALLGVGILASYFLFISPQKKSAAAPANSKEKSIAVIPFKLIGSDEEGRYFAEGVADELINHLHGIESLKVRSRTSVEQYRDTKKMMDEIAKELKVDYIIEGSVQKYKDDIRIIVQLIDPKTDNHLWKDKYDRKFENILNVESEIALQIVKELNVTLAPEQKKRIEKKYARNAEAWDLFLRGKEYTRAWWRYHEMNDLDFAISFFSQSLKKDSLFALGYTWLAIVIAQKEFFRDDPKKEESDSAFHLVQKSIQLDPDLPKNYESLSYYYRLSKKDYKAAMENIEKAIRIDPDNQGFLLSKGRIFSGQSRDLDALEIFNAAIKKDQSEEFSWLMSDIGWSYICIGEFEMSEIFLKKALEKEPDNLQFLGNLAHLQMITGRYSEFQKTVNKSLSIRKDNLGLKDLGKAYLLLGNYRGAEKAYRQVFALPQEKYFYFANEKHAFAQVLRKLGKEKEALKYIQESKAWIEKNMPDPNYDLAKVYSFLGEKQKALDYLKKWKPNWGVHIWVEKDPLFENIKDEPDFKQLVQRFKSEIEILRKEARTKIANGEFPTPEMIAQ